MAVEKTRGTLEGPIVLKHLLPLHLSSAPTFLSWLKPPKDVGQEPDHALEARVASLHPLQSEEEQM